MAKTKPSATPSDNPAEGDAQAGGDPLADAEQGLFAEGAGADPAEAAAPPAAPLVDAPVQQLPAAAFDLTVEEFCQRVSRERLAPETLGGFCASERASGRVKDSEDAYRQRLAAFEAQPV